MEIRSGNVFRPRPSHKNKLSPIRIQNSMDKNAACMQSGSESAFLIGVLILAAL
jgi:hypothetical protein